MMHEYCSSSHLLHISYPPYGMYVYTNITCYGIHISSAAWHGIGYDEMKLSAEFLSEEQSEIRFLFVGSISGIFLFLVFLWM